MTLLRKGGVLFLAILLASGSVASAADSKPPQKPSAADIASSADLQKLIKDFNARRDSLLAQREALLNQLRNATDEQKKAILDKMQTQQKDLLEAQRALGKQIRDEMRKLQQDAVGPHR